MEGKKVLLTTDALDEMIRCSEALKLKNREEILQRAMHYYRLLKINFPEKKIKRNVILSSCIYISSFILGEHVTQAELAKAFNISESTLNRRYKEILKPLFPDIGKCCKTLT